MAMHEWKCKTCSIVTQVVRGVKAYAEQPTKEEQKCECETPEFMKVITAAPKASFSGNWSPGFGNGGGKGRW